MTQTIPPIYQLKRQAKALSRGKGIALSAAQNRIAQSHGFAHWSLLARRHACRPDDAQQLFASLRPGDLVLLGGRPGEGKTRLGLTLVATALARGHHAAFFSLEYTTQQAMALLREVAGGRDLVRDRLTLDTSDAISAAHITHRLAGAAPGTLAVIDYLQLLDQDRRTPPLNAQVAALKSCAETRGAILVLLSQIDRSYDPTARPLPDHSDVRLPNPVDLDQFSRLVFLGRGAVPPVATP